MYTLRRDRCPYCGGELKAAHPAKFSPEDPYGEYRRKMKLETLAGRGSSL
ncbi:nucleolar RNA-binding Nop10p family protein [Infirmifilum lucidum]|uniref:Nucleolar RNA-binding Nop10p family protein n=2 Tax=Infirmifilum lucidum TaxID=2776706 RepID=A0A7L9FJ05_9CREN|nr:nucleolar RNA-binding Nop10p family protein [Infirmifilum lucidum]